MDNHFGTLSERLGALLTASRPSRGTHCFPAFRPGLRSSLEAISLRFMEQNLYVVTLKRAGIMKIGKLVTLPRRMTSSLRKLVMRRGA